MVNLPPPPPLLALSSHLLRVFLGIVTLTSFYNGRRLFIEPTGRSHRLAGLAHLLCIVAGALSFVAPPPSPTITHSWAYQCLVYDICIGILGTAATLTAARAFPHKTLVNAPGQSGTLSEHAYVTQSEMIEHSFYQMLNLIQAIEGVSVFSDTVNVIDLIKEIIKEEKQAEIYYTILN